VSQVVKTDVGKTSAQYLRGLLSQHGERRNAENLAEAVAEATPRAFPRLVTESPWECDALIEALQAFLSQLLNADDGIWSLEEIAVPKHGHHSVVVVRQAYGPAGNVSNCQVGIFLARILLSRPIVDTLRIAMAPSGAYTGKAYWRAAYGTLQDATTTDLDRRGLYD
jgi:hypothetical protein